MDEILGFKKLISKKKVLNLKMLQNPISFLNKPLQEILETKKTIIYGIRF